MLKVLSIKSCLRHAMQVIRTYFAVVNTRLILSVSLVKFYHISSVLKPSLFRIKQITVISCVIILSRSFEREPSLSSSASA